jgi:drug/metabolite transporter (DMT)-like permease
VPLHVIGVVLVAALLHATWNLLVRSGTDRALDTILVATVAGAISLPVALLLPAPARESWPHVAASALIHAVYFLALAEAYRDGHFGPSYTIMRGTAPLLVTLLGVAGVASEPAAATTWLGAAVVSGGILAMAALAPRGGVSRRGAAFVALNACVIALYTIVDGTGARRSGAPVAYTAWVFLLDVPPLVAVALATRGRAALAHARTRWARAAAGGALTVTSYALALWAMTRAPIAAVAALRETSVVFATMLGTWRLGEPLGPARLAAACAVALGIALLER